LFQGALAKPVAHNHNWIVWDHMAFRLSGREVSEDPTAIPLAPLLDWRRRKLVHCFHSPQHAI
jgi:hypothetical protein